MTWSIVVIFVFFFHKIENVLQEKQELLKKLEKDKKETKAALEKEWEQTKKQEEEEWEKRSEELVSAKVHLGFRMPSVLVPKFDYFESFLGKRTDIDYQFSAIHKEKIRNVNMIMLLFCCRSLCNWPKLKFLDHTCQSYLDGGAC